MKSPYKYSIPFVNAERIGNFKLWRSKYNLKTSEGKAGIYCIHISTLDGSWMVRIPETWEAFGQLARAYNDYADPKATAEDKAMGETLIAAFCSNILYTSCTANGFYTKAVQMVTTAFYNPDILRDKKELKALKQDATSLMTQFLEWRKAYEKALEKLQPTEEEEKREELADKALDIINET